MGSSYAVQTPLTRLVDEHAKCLARIAELEAALREIADLPSWRADEAVVLARTALTKNPGR